jgi:hypothetical protein
MSAGEKRPRDRTPRRDLWLAGPDDDVVYEIDEEAVARLRAVIAAAAPPRPRRRDAVVRRPPHLAAIASRS